jgi:hypothetical protein
MYRARIPTPAQRFGGQPRMLGIENPQGNTGALGRIGSGLRSVVESLDPRAIAREGGRSVQHVVGDVGELAKSVVTGKDTLSQSPSARAYQAAGGGVGGVAAAALPYVNVGTAVLPTTRVLTPAGRAAMAADATERVGQALLSRGIATATPGARRAGADAAERLAQTMAARDAGIGAQGIRAERPTITMKPFAREASDGGISIVSETGTETLRPIPPSTQRPSWMAPEPTPTLSQRDMDLLRYNPVEQSSTPDQLVRNLEAMARGRNPITRNVDWSSANPVNDVDLTRVFTNELDAQMASPDAGALWVAQKAAKSGAVDYLIRNGLQSELILTAPSYVNLRTLPTYIETQDWSTLMRAVPQLQNYYVDVMRSYGIGL